MTNREATSGGAAVPAPTLRVVAGQLDDAQLAALVAVTSTLPAAGHALPPSPAWRRAALAEQSGAAPAASPRDLDARLR